MRQQHEWMMEFIKDIGGRELPQGLVILTSNLEVIPTSLVSRLLDKWNMNQICAFRLLREIISIFFHLFRCEFVTHPNEACKWRTFSELSAQIEALAKFRAFQIYSRANLHPRVANERERLN